ncbi:glycosyl hydrolase 115 family protein [Ereboglobus sp. PH5-5]|uniref:glycosyl hydrolase 115 family protein n=1 Tax=Ereboglobus sp. PH5-5 TaxID=2940529 RepID=UPI002404DE0F|nr:glycosyl hydrolase 115 family protein [Ereboglobus sp. PH5-5]
MESLPPDVTHIIIAGTVEKNAHIRRLASSGKLDLSPILGKWEQYIIQQIDAPFPETAPHVKTALVIAGSDRRAVAYGLFFISERIGVSPWYWWADVPVKKQSEIALDINKTVSKAPSVKYRGIFINDEDWGLKPWASKTYDPELGDIGPKTYAKICELLLRLKANYLCPAMHSCTGAFNKYPDNKVVADSYAIVMGSVHCEPLLYNNASEWDRKTMGVWNYATNKENINKVLRRRVNENGRYENVYTLAMRGIHDSVMAGNLTLAQQARLLEKVFDDQRGILSSTLGRPASEIPQAFTPYKEVLETYEHGLRLPDDVTIIWGDDDFGYMKRLSNPDEQKRPGRAGVYYHLSYWGPPRHFLWINTTPPALMYNELKKAHDTTADRVWLANVGDIKPAEYAISLFMDMAWDIHSFNPQNIIEHPVDFLCKIFSERHRADFNDIIKTYYHLAFIRKPEYMEKSGDTEFSIVHSREADLRLAAYARIAQKSAAILKSLPPDEVPAYFQLVHYPVCGSAMANEISLLAQKNRLYSAQQRASARAIKERVLQRCADLQALTKEYNTLLNGKWNGMMSLVHGGARSFEIPRLATPKLDAVPRLGVAAEGMDYNLGTPRPHTLPAFSKYLEKAYYIDIYNKGTGTLEWNATPSASWIILSKTSGATTDEARVEVSIDWRAAPRGTDVLGSIKISATSGGEQTVTVPLFNPAAPEADELKGLYVEDNGQVSISADGFHRKIEDDDIKFTIKEGLGTDNRVLQLGEPLAVPKYLDSLVLTSNYVAPARRNYPRVEYDFYTFHAGQVDVYTHMIPVFPLNSSHGTRYGVMVDNSPVYLPESGAPYYSTPWIQSILRNNRINKTTHYLSSPGKHTLKIYCAHPGAMLQKVVIDCGGMKRTYAGPPPTLAR